MNQAISDVVKNLTKEDIRQPIPLPEYFENLAKKPRRSLRNVFQLMYDMVHHYVPEGYDEYPDDPESISYLQYDTSDLFVRGENQPYFADRLFANRLFNLIDSYKGAQENKIFLFEGPPGSGKSTFLNNFLHKLETYTHIDEGMMHEVIWRIDVDRVGGFNSNNPQGHESNLNSVEDTLSRNGYPTTLDVPCPNHDHPILVIPKEHRGKFLDNLIEDEEFKEKLFNNKEYDWVFKKEPCTICNMVYDALLSTMRQNDPEETDIERIHHDIFNMIHARRYVFNRKMGDGVTIFNPGDVDRDEPIRNPVLQDLLNKLFKDSNAVRYVHSNLANTNNGIYAVMDMKEHNRKRFKNLHGIISDGVHKVENIEEYVQSVFMGLMNPEDRDSIKNGVSFLDRIVRIPMPYVLDYKTESNIYRQKFGGQVNSEFLPHILEYFGRAVIASRIPGRSDTLENWLGGNRNVYATNYCDKDLRLLKAELYGGLIPEWLREEDVRNFQAPVRRQLISEGATDGFRGISGRKSIELFNDFYSRYSNQDKLINIEDVINFFYHRFNDDSYAPTNQPFGGENEEEADTDIIENAINAGVEMGLITQEQADNIRKYTDEGGILDQVTDLLDGLVGQFGEGGSLQKLAGTDDGMDEFPGEMNDFLGSLQHLYDYRITQEIKEALYEHNVDTIDEDIKNYLFAVNFDPGKSDKNPFTNQWLDITQEFFDNIESKLIDISQISRDERLRFREYVQNQYSNALAHIGAQVMNGEGIKETEIYNNLYEMYTHNLKDNVLDIFESDSFIRAIKDYGTKAFESYDNRVQKDVNQLVKNLGEKGYSERAAMEMTHYFIETDVFKKFSQTPQSSNEGKNTGMGLPGLGV